MLYAGAWRAERKPWTLISGGDEGGIWKTTDGGDTWEKLGGGLPEGLLGRIGVTVSPANPARVWALLEAEDGRSEASPADRVRVLGTVLSVMRSATPEAPALRIVS